MRKQSYIFYLIKQLRFPAADILLYCGMVMAPITGFAQQRQTPSDSVSISASATVIGNSIELLTISEMSLVEASQMAEEEMVYINPIFDPEAGILKALGQPHSLVRVSYISEREIFRKEGPGSLVFYYEVSGFGSDSQRESELLEDLEREVRLNENGEFYFWIGGRVNLQNAISGSYEGEFTIEIEYI